MSEGIYIVKKPFGAYRAGDTVRVYQTATSKAGSYRLADGTYAPSSSLEYSRPFTVSESRARDKEVGSWGATPSWQGNVSKGLASGNDKAKPKSSTRGSKPAGNPSEDSSTMGGEQPPAEGSKRSITPWVIGGIVVVAAALLAWKYLIKNNKNVNQWVTSRKAQR